MAKEIRWQKGRCDAAILDHDSNAADHVPLDVLELDNGKLDEEMTSPSVRECLEQIVHIRQRGLDRELNLQKSKKDYVSEVDVDEASLRLMEALLELARHLEGVPK